MATEKWVPGAVSSWTLAFGSEINSLASGDAVQSSVVIDNTTAEDMFIIVSMSLGSIAVGSGAQFMSISRYDLNEDGSSYGDGQYTSAAAGAPPYMMGFMQLPTSVTGAQKGGCMFELPPNNKCVLVLCNNSGATLASSGNAIKYMTANRAVA
jgi:hypothetical protein